MSFDLNQVVPWGRCLDEYRRMFSLTADDLDRQILGCADGPASFNAELTAAGGKVVSCDPIYQHSPAEIRSRIEATTPQILKQASENEAQFVWSDKIPDITAMAGLRGETMERFLIDFQRSRSTHRYIAAQLPHLPFDDHQFEIAVCSHFLFLYSEQLSQQFHLDSLLELIRVAHDVRVFPILDLQTKHSHHLQSVTEKLVAAGHQVSIEKVDYEFQRGGNEMLRIIRSNPAKH